MSARNDVARGEDEQLKFFTKQRFNPILKGILPTTGIFQKLMHSFFIQCSKTL
jgi:hypothetical protein